MWHQENYRDGWATCPITQNGLLRIVSQPKYTYPNSVAQLRIQLKKATGSEFHQFWPDDISLADDATVDTNFALTSGMLTDVYLLALAVKNQGRLITLDSKIFRSAVRGAQEEHLLAI